MCFGSSMLPIFDRPCGYEEHDYRIQDDATVDEHMQSRSPYAREQAR